MKLIDLIRVASQGYEESFPESPLTLQVDDGGKPLDPPADGDYLARFIVCELAETYDEAASDRQQLAEAVRVVGRGIDDLFGVLISLVAASAEKVRQPVEGGMRPPLTDLDAARVEGWTVAGQLSGGKNPSC